MSERSLSDFMKMPAIVTKGNTLITIEEQRQIVIDNYKGILLYDDCQVTLQVRNGTLKVHGTRLQIDYFTKNDIRISGHINKIEWD
jgi:sporulation protein YqfC